jgi:hypothetical protein
VVGACHRALQTAGGQPGQPGLRCGPSGLLPESGGDDDQGLAVEVGECLGLGEGGRQLGPLDPLAAQFAGGRGQGEFLAAGLRREAGEGASGDEPP